MASMLDLLPTPAKLYLQALSGNKEPITEADFSPAELEAIQSLIAGSQRQGAVQYPDYGSDQPGMMGMFNPKGRIANSLGQFNYQQTPDGTLVTDKYDFNPTYKEDSSLINVLNALGTAGFSPMHLLGEYLVPPGSGREVKIKLPKRP